MNFSDMFAELSQKRGIRYVFPQNGKDPVISEIRSLSAETTPFVYKMGFIRFSLVVGNDLFEFT